MTTATLKINRRIKDLVGSSTLAITARAKELQAQGRDVVNFGAGEPDFDTPDSIKAAGIRAIEKGFTKYTPSTGTLELREAIALKFQKDNHLTYKPSQIAVSCGAKHSIFNIIQVLADGGEEVLIPAPYWVSYPEMVRICGAESKFLATSAKTNFKITPRQLSENITGKTKVLILNSPSNPTGMLYSKKELEAVLLHEIGHIKHHSGWLKLSTYLQRLASPFSVFVDLNSALSRSEQEADSFAIKIQGTSRYLNRAKQRVNEFEHCS